METAKGKTLRLNITHVHKHNKKRDVYNRYRGFYAIRDSWKGRIPEGDEPWPKKGKLIQTLHDVLGKKVDDPEVIKFIVGRYGWSEFEMRYRSIRNSLNISRWAANKELNMIQPRGVASHHVERAAEEVEKQKVRRKAREYFDFVDSAIDEEKREREEQVNEIRQNLTSQIESAI